MNIFAIEFLNDMQKVGLSTWIGMFVVFAAFTWIAWDGVWYLKAGGAIMSVNMIGAIIATAWWQYRGRGKHAY